MKPFKFKHHNAIAGDGQKEYVPLPILRFGNDPEGQIVSCWKLSFKEKVKILFTGKMWLSMFTYQSDLQPSLMSVHRKAMYSLPRDKMSFKQKAKHDIVTLFKAAKSAMLSVFKKKSK